MGLAGVSERGQQAAGAVFIALVGGAVATVLALSGHTTGSGVRFEVELASAGALKADARIRLAGRDIGEVRAIRRGADNLAPEGRHAIAECFVARAWAEHLHTNSDYFVATPSILGEAWLEVGAPLRGAEPGPLVAAGQRVRGADPADLDRMLTRLYTSGTAIVLLAREHRGEIDDFLAALDSLIATASGIPIAKGQLARIRDNALAAIDDTRRIVRAVDDSRVIPRAGALAREISATADRVRPDLADVARHADLAILRVEALRGFVSPAQLDAASAALSRLGDVARRTDAIVADAQALADKVNRGEGTVGGLLGDRELFDDLHESHRILKWQGWKLIVKRKPGATRPE